MTATGIGMQLLVVLLVALPFTPTFASTMEATPEIAIVNGRVVDPETGLDDIRHVVINGGRIVKITSTRPVAQQVIDADGLVVAPGFIDLHAHGQDLESNRLQVADGVTSALELEIGAWPLREYYEERRDRALIHYGATVSHLVARYAASRGDDESRAGVAYAEAAYASESARSPLTTSKLSGLLARLGDGFEAGALGIGFGIQYTPGADHKEIYESFAVAAAKQAPVVVHLRGANQTGGDRLAPVQEVIASAYLTGAPLHIVHLNSSTGDSAKIALEWIRRARQNGLDVTTESYPYTAGSTDIQSAFFDNWTGDVSNLQWAATGERLTRESFLEYRKRGGTVYIHGLSEEVCEWLVAQSDVIVASDGISFKDGMAHPRGAGTFARVLGHYARDRKSLELRTALAKMTLLPARRLEHIAPQMKRKGRIQEGADADITVFDPATIIDRATYVHPQRRSEGIRYVLVNGVLVVSQGELVEGVAPGQPIYGRFKD